jgi:hypothetical protein
MLEARLHCLHGIRRREGMHLLTDEFGIEQGLGFDGHEVKRRWKRLETKMARGSEVWILIGYADEGIRTPVPEFQPFLNDHGLEAWS